MAKVTGDMDAVMAVLIVNIHLSGAHVIQISSHQWDHYMMEVIFKTPG